MDAKYIIPEGDVLKYKLEIKHEDFDMQTCDFEVILSYGMLGQSLTVKKSQMPCDEDKNWYLVFSTKGMVGKVLATCRYMVPDSDMPSGARDEYNRQYLCFVTANPCVHLDCCCEDCPEPEDDHVTYTRVWRSDVNTLYLNLRTTEENGEHRPVMDSEGQQIRVRKEDKDIH